MIYYLGAFPTPGGNKYHLLSVSQENGVLTGTVTNSLGPVELYNCKLTEHGFSADRPDPHGSQHYDVTYTKNDLHLTGYILDGDRVMGSFEADMLKTDSDFLPKDPEGAGGPDMPPPPPGT